ncbi:MULTISPECIES: pilus assembly protein TadG-related protein [Amycolatopsis]|uniref:pilus assembly protein TadG-related protein n=1 Tax=Amycolatopsis TaxID=1813 RepID=UPI001FE7A1DF|nr:pilus assembly protein TadG-related protein [Amycolatopsis sacchari]
MTAFVVIIVTACLILAGLVLDGGLALSTKARAIGQAEEAARAGAQELDLQAYRAGRGARLQPSAAAAAAYQYLRAAGANGTVTVSGNTVTVFVTAQSSTQLLGLVGVRGFTVTGSGRAEPEQTPGAAP